MSKIIINMKMLYSMSVAYLIILLNTACTSPEPATNIKLIPLFTNNMVLQQEQENKIWGIADAGGEVTIEIDGQIKRAIVDTSDNWSVTLDPMRAGGPLNMKVMGKDIHEINNIMVGEVWVCSGQSNMEMAINAGWGKVNDYEKELANASYPDIRLLQVEKAMAIEPQKSFISDGWKESSAVSAAEFSAVAYFFGRHLHNELQVPIGLIQSAWGGTVAEAWTSGRTLLNDPDFSNYVKNLQINNDSEKAKAESLKKEQNEWPDKIEEILLKEEILVKGFQKGNMDRNKWKSMSLPSIWEDKGIDVDGVVWFSKVIKIPAHWKDQEIKLSLGRINDFDITWFNGEKIGRGIEATDLRKYKVPNSLVKTGENTIVVQVLDIGNVGGLYGPKKEMKIESEKGSISLAGNWKYHIDDSKLKIPQKPRSKSGPNRPTVLYNGMISPIINYGIKGAIWYQGEANAERAYQYRNLFKSLITDWRKSWNNQNLPFLFVQLANFKKRKSLPSEDSWAELREAQLMALELPYTGMAVAIDIGDAEDIHPKNKQDVGRRLGLNALSIAYGKEVAYSGPSYQSMNIEDSRIRVKFNHVDGGLKIKDGKKLEGFAIAGSNKKFRWANAKIVGSEVVVSHPKIKNPVAVRYAWASNPKCNLYNDAGLPASPFRTDNWPGITVGKK